MKKKNIKVGRIVYLKSGGPPMTILAINDNLVHVEFWKHSQEYRGVYHIKTVTGDVTDEMRYWY